MANMFKPAKKAGPSSNKKTGPGQDPKKPKTGDKGSERPEEPSEDG